MLRLKDSSQMWRKCWWTWKDGAQGNLSHLHRSPALKGLPVSLCLCLFNPDTFKVTLVIFFELLSLPEWKEDRNSSISKRLNCSTNAFYFSSPIAALHGQLLISSTLLTWIPNLCDLSSLYFVSTGACCRNVPWEPVLVSLRKPIALCIGAEAKRIRRCT